MRRLRRSLLVLSPGRPVRKQPESVGKHGLAALSLDWLRHSDGSLRTESKTPYRGPLRTLFGSPILDLLRQRVTLPELCAFRQSQPTPPLGPVHCEQKPPLTSASSDYGGHSRSRAEITGHWNPLIHTIGHGRPTSSLPLPYENILRGPRYRAGYLPLSVQEQKRVPALLTSTARPVLGQLGSSRAAQDPGRSFSSYTSAGTNPSSRREGHLASNRATPGSRRSFSTVTTAAISPGTRILVVQPRVRPLSLLRSQLAEALQLVEALRERKGFDAASSSSFFGARSWGLAELAREEEGAREWWPGGGIRDPWVVVGPSAVRCSAAKGRPHRPSGAHSAAAFFGKGHVETVAAHVTAADSESRPINAVFVNTSLTGGQQRNLERAWGKRVVDRVGVIIDIFGAHAATREAKLQVELAALEYQRSRLVRTRADDGKRVGFGEGEEAQVVSAKGKAGAGGRGFLSGAGESELQLQRTRIGQKQHKLRKLLEVVRRTRALHRAGRRRLCTGWGGRGTGLPLVALVGYTNAGKSSLLEALSGSSQFQDNKLFATLDPCIRSVQLPSGRRALFCDTVGFIADLPHQLVEAFHATLEEVLEADLLVHVIDGSSVDAESQRSAVLGVLSELLRPSTPPRHKQSSETLWEGTILEAWCKADLWGSEGREEWEACTMVQRGKSKQQYGLDEGQSSAEEEGEEMKEVDAGKLYAAAGNPMAYLRRIHSSPTPLQQNPYGQRERWPPDTFASVKVPPRMGVSSLTGEGLKQLLQAVDGALQKRGF